MKEFEEVYRLLGPDTVSIGQALGIPEHEADRLVNKKLEIKRRKQAYRIRRRDELREIRARRPA